MQEIKEVVQKDLLDALGQVLDSLSRKNTAELSELSNHTIHNASIFQDEDSISFAVVVYALSKMLSRNMDGMASRIYSILRRANSFLRRGKVHAYRKNINHIFRLISRTDKKFAKYVMEVVNEAQIKKGSSLYDHGISLPRTAEMLGISQWELMNYVGKTSITDAPETRTRVKRRLEFARKVFNVGE